MKIASPIVAALGQLDLMRMSRLRVTEGRHPAGKLRRIEPPARHQEQYLTGQNFQPPAINLGNVRPSCNGGAHRITHGSFSRIGRNSHYNGGRGTCIHRHEQRER